jgi:hypothetical protein
MKKKDGQSIISNFSSDIYGKYSVSWVILGLNLDIQTHHFWCSGNLAACCMEQIMK